ncbi:fibronectin type III domain protein [Prevotella sp. DNF00663]|uniref:golvesin C-terminal-like domain-containing protein n=1 Tax=unclassified Prevotella TaxID=2638335 RepID=UPI00051357E2|nr:MULTISPECIES: xanthan lyase [unclassified Prevotella]KGI60526.1 xanthan lyase [Prevotella sp. S7 MS 2]KXB85657.1 fibronectin type III domain protein [Prevotella sp. DNF00663]
MNKKIILLIASCILSFEGFSQETIKLNASINNRLYGYFGDIPTLDNNKNYVSNISVDNRAKSVIVSLRNIYAQLNVTPKQVGKTYKIIRKELPRTFKDYTLKVLVNNLPIEYLPKDSKISSVESRNLWGSIEYDGTPWVSEVTKPCEPYHGLYNKHISVWASHGRYFNNNKQIWEWQRPNLFGTTEDLFTQTIVVPYLIPMLQNAGAVIFTPRERDWQKQEYIVDNDDVNPGVRYLEVNVKHDWKTSKEKGFAWHAGSYADGENPFVAGTAKMAKSTKSNKHFSLLSYQPQIQEAGKYAVYVSYQTLPNSVPDAHYTVYHQGEKTVFRVNQTMGGGTWVYLGTFNFDAGCSEENRVVLTNQSGKRGVVTSDAVRFGGGMGNIRRGTTVSGLPRALEGARYYAQWAGAPYSIYSSKNGQDDYSDDINARSYMTNWLAGGSCFVPTKEGLKVPMELSLAVHSDAGFESDGKSLTGSLAIYTTNFNDGKLSSGVSRLLSRDFAKSLLDGLNRDLSATIGKQWAIRYLWDRNYSETRNPEMPSAILEMLSHQNFPDMVLAQDPNFKFTLARSVYKTILRFINTNHGRPSIVQPLSPQNFSIQILDATHVKLSWLPTFDPLEPTAAPTSFNIYQAIGKHGFDNGMNIKTNSCVINVVPGRQYRFKVTAVNSGGESFPTPVLSSISVGSDKKTVLVVDHFDRLSAPAVIDDGVRQGFDLQEDPGTQRGLYAGWNGLQQDFDRSKMGKEGPGGLGYGSDELAGHLIAGNNFDNVSAHVAAISTAHQYNVVSTTASAVETGMVNLAEYDIVDLVNGLQKYVPHALKNYKVFSSKWQQLLTVFTQKPHVGLIVSGSYNGSDSQSLADSAFLARVLKLQYARSNTETNDSIVSGLNNRMEIYRTLNPIHYAATSTDVLQPASTDAFSAMLYGDGSSASVAYNGQDYNCITLGFPFECIKSKSQQGLIMQGLLQFVDKTENK